MKQVVIIHGGDSYDSYDEYLNNLKNQTIDYERLKPKRSWYSWLAEQLQDCDVLTPKFPNSQNAQYEEWKIYFEKLIPFFSSDVRLVGHSLGAMFLAKYLHEHTLPRPVSQVVLLAGGYDDDDEGYGSFRVERATGMEKSAKTIHLMHSEDDFVVPYTELDKFERDLPEAVVHRFTNRNHFLDEKQPELLEILQQK